MQEIIGQEKAISFLLNSYRQQKISHAYLFLGPQGVGRALVARFLAKLLNCDSRGDFPCLECVSCRKIDNNNHPDIFWIRPEEGSRGIKIEAIRELQERISLKPYEGRFKIFILEEADYLLEDSANCLLKILEEPPPGSVLILIASNINRIVPTIVSRCQIIKFHLLKRGDLTEFLIRKTGLERKRAGVLSHIAEGSPGKALALLEADYWNRRNVVLEGFLKQGEQDDLVWADKKFLLEGTALLLNIFRDMVLIKLELAELLVNIDQKDFLVSFASRYSLDWLYRFIEKLNLYHVWLEQNANTRLVLTNLEIDLK
jgi:DNA polymerase-3 subunit delta'